MLDSDCRFLGRSLSWFCQRSCGLIMAGIQICNVDRWSPHRHMYHRWRLQSAAHLHGHRHSKQRLVSITSARTQLMLTHPPMCQVCTCVQRIVESCGTWKQLCLNICLHNALDIAPLDNGSLEHLQVNRPKNSRPKTGNHLAQLYPPFPPQVAVASAYFANWSTLSRAIFALTTFCQEACSATITWRGQGVVKQVFFAATKT